MTEKERQEMLMRLQMNDNTGCGTPFCLGVLLLVLLFAGCKSVEYVPVETVRHEYHHTTDSIKHTDSVIVERETVVMQMDSSAMAEYGIKLSNAEKAWLVQSKELEKKVKELQQHKTDTIIERDSIPIVVVKEKELTKFQKFKMNFGLFAMGALVLLILLFIYKAFHR